ncbi:MAG: M1 family peptidase, partial [Chitinophagaceae bacterium]
TIMGRNLFDYAFKEYARRWAFKHPTPADLFRTMEDASGEDLDWYWRGWFYGIEACDISLDSVKWSKVDLEAAPVSRTESILTQQVAKPAVRYDDISKIRNREDKKIVFATDADTSLRDFYWKYSRGLAKVDTTAFRIPVPVNLDTLTSGERSAISANTLLLYELTVSNRGGLVMPVIIEWTYKDGTKEITRIPVQIWRKNENKFTKVFVKTKEVASIRLDPMRETADIDEQNNSWPLLENPSKFQVYKARTTNARGAGGGNNPMQKELK